MESTWLAPRFALITCTQKLPDRFVFTASLPVEAHANDPLLIITLEIRQPWQPDSRLVSTITDVLSQRYPTIRRSTNPLQSFELSLKNINEELMGLAEAGETDWIGRLSGVIALVIGNEIHVAQTGQATAFLFRQQKISQILEKQDITDPHPLTTFSNIISGYTNAGDRLVLGNDDLFTLVPLESIRGAVSDETPWQAVQTLARALKRTRVISVAAAVLGVEQAKTWEEVGDEPIVVNLEEYTQSWVKKLWKTVRPALVRGHESARSALKRTRVAAASSSEHWKKSLAPKARDMWQSRTRRKEQASSAPGSTAETIRPAFIDNIASILLDTESALTITLAKPVARFAAPVTAWLSKINQQASIVARPLQRWHAGTQNRWMFVLIAIVLISTAAYSAHQRRLSVDLANQLATNDRQISTAKTGLEKLNSALHLNQKDDVAGQLATITQSLDEIQSPSSEQTAVLADLRRQLSTTEDLINQVVRVKAEHQYAAPVDALMIAVSETQFVTVAGQKIASLSRQTGDDNIISAPQIIQAITYDSDRSLFILSLTDGSTFSLANDGAALTPISISEGTAPLGSIRTYGRNLYTVEPSTNTLWKMAASGNGYGKPTPVVANDTLAAAKDLAIDGAIFVLLSDNTVGKYSRGQLDAAFALKNTPAHDRYDQLFTDPQADFLYLVDLTAGRISAYDKSGEYIEQYALDLSDLKQVVIDASAQRAYILSGSLISEYGL